MRVKEWQGDVVFLHEVVPGAADRSYGIQVAKLAGLPATRDRARQDGAGRARSARIAPRRRRRLIDDLPLFAATRPFTDTDLAWEDEPNERDHSPPWRR